MLKLGLCLLIPAVLLGIAGAARRGEDSEELFDPPAAGAVRPGEPVELQIMTYNVRGRPVLDDTVAKFRMISPLLNDSDIVGIQECFQDHRVLWEGATHQTKLHHGTLKAPWRIVGSGLSTLARFPLIARRVEFFQTAGELQNVLASKAMLLTRLDVHGMTLDVYNSHFDAGASPAAHRSRRHQGRQMVEFVRRHSPPENSVLILADFNMSPHRDGRPWNEYAPRRYRSERDMQARTRGFDRFLAELGFADVADTVHGPVGDDVDRVLYRAGRDHTFEPLGWTRAAAGFVDRAGHPLSDHVPIVVRMRLSS